MSSEGIRKELDQEDNDLKAMGLMSKLLKSERHDRFTDKWQAFFVGRLAAVQQKSGAWRIIHSKYGKVDYWPGPNKAHVHSKNWWIKPGLKWILNSIEP